MAARLGVVTGQGLSRPHPRPVRRALDGLRDGRPARRQHRQHGRRVRRRRGRPRDLRRSRAIVGPDRRRRDLGARAVRVSYRTVERVFLSVIARLRDLHRRRRSSPTPTGAPVGQGVRDARRSRPGPAIAAADGRRRRHDDHAVHAVLPPERGRREGHRRGGAAARAGRRGRRRRSGPTSSRSSSSSRPRRRCSRPAARSRRPRPMRRRRSSPSPGELAEPLFAIGLFGASRARGDDHADLHRVRDLRGLRLGVRRRQAVPRRAARSSGSTRSCCSSARSSCSCPGST